MGGHTQGGEGGVELGNSPPPPPPTPCESGFGAQPFFGGSRPPPSLPLLCSNACLGPDEGALRLRCAVCLRDIGLRWMGPGASALCSTAVGWRLEVNRRPSVVDGRS